MSRPAQLAEAGVLDVLSSDYMHGEPVDGGDRDCSHAVPGFEASGRDPHRHQDAGRSGRALATAAMIIAGKRADLIRVHVADGVPFVPLDVALRRPRGVGLSSCVSRANARRTSAGGRRFLKTASKLVSPGMAGS